MYELAVCELFHPYLHGHDDNSSAGVIGHYLVYMTLTASEFFSGDYEDELSIAKRYLSSDIALLHRNRSRRHPTIRNYYALTQNMDRYMSVQIVKQEELQPGGEQVGYIKTFWLRILQRRWRNVCRRRREIKRARCLPQHVRYRQLHGRWPAALNQWPCVSIFGGNLCT